MITFRCSGCGHEVQLDDSLAGMKARCRKCGQTGLIATSRPTQLADQRSPVISAFYEEGGIVRFLCPQCGKKLGVKAESKGKQVRCPRCAQVVQVPSDLATGVPPAAEGEPLTPGAAGQTGTPVEKPRKADDPGQALEGLAEPEGDVIEASHPPTEQPAVQDARVPQEERRTAKTNGPGQGRGGEDDPQRTLTTPPTREGRAPSAGEVPQIENYRITGRLGEGGMGVVWRAAQLGTHREVALKLLPAAQFTSGRARALFEREVDLSARLEHPNIARVYDSGIHHNVYFYAMELVEGVPLDEYVQANRLGRRQILELMQTVCQAVQHAHQRGVIHRDLKPSNILVSADGQPHVLDFGLAKALGEKDRNVTVTGEGAIMGTPAYMAPEQAAGKVDHVDTRSDVYSLGVVLYRLLTGRNPHNLEGGYLEVLRRIAEEEVARPGKEIDRELEAILLKALAQKAEERYASAGDLAEDIGRCMRGDPLIARPPTTMYFLRKKVRKHWVPVAAGCAAFMAVVATGLYAYVQVRAEKNAATSEWRRAEGEKARADVQRDKAVGMEQLALKRLADTEAAQKKTEQEKAKAEKEAAKATAVTGFLTSMLTTIQPRIAQGKEVTVREVLDEAAKTLGEQFKDKPETEGAIRHTTGVTYHALGLFALAEEHLRAALRLRESALGPEHRDTLRTMYELGKELKMARDLAESEGLHRKAWETARRVLGPDDDDTLAFLSALASLLQSANKDPEAEPLFRESFELRRERHGKEDPGTLTAARNLCANLRKQKKYAEAEILARESLDIIRRTQGEESPAAGKAMGQLADVLAGQGKKAESDELDKKAIQIHRGKLGVENSETLQLMSSIAWKWSSQDRFAEAEAMYHELIEGQRKVFGPEHQRTIASSRYLAAVLQKQKKYDEAEKLYRETMELAARALGPNDSTPLQCMYGLALVFEGQGKAAEAAEMRKECQRLEAMRKPASQPATRPGAASPATTKGAD